MVECKHKFGERIEMDAEGFAVFAGCGCRVTKDLAVELFADSKECYDVVSLLLQEMSTRSDGRT